MLVNSLVISRLSKQPTVYETLSLANTSVEVKTKAKNLGVIMDKKPVMLLDQLVVFESTFLPMN